MVSNRPHNKGVRLDYFLCSGDMFEPAPAPSAQTGTTGVPPPPSVNSAAGTAQAGGPVTPTVQSMEGVQSSAVAAGPARSSPVRVYDTYILHEDTVGVSDHCPIVLVLSL
jgi:hypothetical protein